MSPAKELKDHQFECLIQSIKEKLAKCAKTTFNESCEIVIDTWYSDKERLINHFRDAGFEVSQKLNYEGLFIFSWKHAT